MIRPCVAAVLAAVLTGVSSAQAPAPVGKLRWPAAGSALVYKVDYTTTQAHTLKDTTSTAKSSTSVERRWKVLETDRNGSATLEMSLTRMAQERTTSSGAVWKFDTADLKGSTPEMREAMLKFINTPIATVKVDPYGRVLGIKSVKGDPSAYSNEVPFVGTVPGVEMKPGLSWVREFDLTLAPPLGAGEKYKAVQKFTVTAVKGALVTVAMTSELKEKPKATGDMIPLWQMLPKGDLVWDMENGRLHSARLTVDEELRGHDGEGSHTRFTSLKTITLVPAK
jgi:hypothetical protein